MASIANGEIVILANKNHKGLKPVGIGMGLTTKVNANIGASPVRLDMKNELGKLDAALDSGADTIMDLTITKRFQEIDEIRRNIINKCHAPIGTVPIYQAVVETKNPDELSMEKYLDVFERHAIDGVDFMTVHAGVTKGAFPLLKNRLMAVVSRGGSLLLHWMKRHDRENLLYEYYSEILAIAKEYDVTLSLGDGLRPGCIADATDEAQIHELRIIGELVDKARENDVQVMVEGPGHIPLDEIEENVRLEKEICHDAPFYVLGPLPIDTAAGYDHIAGAIGGAWAAKCGADFLCYITPKEHIGLPNIDDVKEGVIATKIAAISADVAKGNHKAKKASYSMSQARKEWDWSEMSRHAIDSSRIKRSRSGENDVEQCSMCGEYCALKFAKET
jgi:phosphomethylpyrimidine synthase